MESINRMMLQEQERKLDCWLFIISELSCCLSFLWMVFCYYLFFFQQLVLLRHGGGKGEIFLPSMLWIAYFMVCCSPSKSKNCGKKMTINDWKLIPNRLFGVVSFLLLSYFLLKYVPVTGRIYEDAVRIVYWRSLVTGLWILMFFTTISIRWVFHMKLYPTVTLEHCVDRNSKVRRIVLLAMIVVLTLLFIVFTTFEIDPLQFPNFIYS